MNGVSSRPEKEVRIGSVRAAVWTNPRRLSNGRSFDSHRVILERTYRDAQGDFKTTPTLELNDIPKAILALKKVYEYCLTRKKDTDAAAVEFTTPQAPRERIP